jgi:CBS domain containing-hemolysin-like protein
MRSYHIVALTQSIESLLNDMQRMHMHIALVQNEYGDVIGMVTMEDIIEELIGDVQDEGDQEIQPYTLLEDGTWSVHGQASIADLNEMLPEPIIEDSRYATL